MRKQSKRSKAVTGPLADPAFRQVAAPEIRLRAQLAHLVHHVRHIGQRCIGHPIGNLVLLVWRKGWPGARWVEARGLPRHSVQDYLGEEALVVHLDPRELIQFAEVAQVPKEQRPSSLAFIWDGDWDERRTDLRNDFWLSYVRDLDENRHQLERTRQYQKLMAQAQAGKPYRSHQEGIYLNTPDRILTYLRVYLGFLDGMAKDGYDVSRPKDHLGVVISRNGRILKINRGLHRLAMAQWLGLASVPVLVRHVHRDWWDQITQGSSGDEALARMAAALPHCQTEQERGRLSIGPPTAPDGTFWPTTRLTSQQHIR